jgi:hypothetical protein
LPTSLYSYWSSYKFEIEPQQSSELKRRWG